MALVGLWEDTAPLAAVALLLVAVPERAASSSPSCSFDSREGGPHLPAQSLPEQWTSSQDARSNCVHGSQYPRTCEPQEAPPGPHPFVGGYPADRGMQSSSTRSAGISPWHFAWLHPLSGALALCVAHFQQDDRVAAKHSQDLTRHLDTLTSSPELASQWRVIT